jgi:hypothetical protein
VFLGHSSPWLYRYVFAVVSGVLLASGHVPAGIITAAVALILAVAWMLWGDTYRRDSTGSL